jgi:heat shock protein HtpX
MRNVRVWLLMAAMTVPFVSLGWLLAGRVGLMLGLALGAAMNVAAYFASSSLVLNSYGARIVDEHEAPGFHQVVARLCTEAGLAMPTLAIAPYRQPNAFVTGRDGNHAVLCVTEEVLALFDGDELAAVLAHEVAHMKNHDMLLQTLAAAMAGTIADPRSLGLLLGIRRGDAGRRVEGWTSRIFGPIAALVVQLSIRRDREFEADATAARMTDRPLALASALRTLDEMARIPMDVPLAVALLAQVDPVAGHEAWMPRLFATHPPVAERIARLTASAERTPPAELLPI